MLYKVVTCKGDAELEASLKMFLPPVLLKMSSSDAKVKMKVMEVLGQINKVRMGKGYYTLHEGTKKTNR